MRDRLYLEDVTDGTYRCIVTPNVRAPYYVVEVLEKLPEMILADGEYARQVPRDVAKIFKHSPQEKVVRTENNRIYTRWTETKLLRFTDIGPEIKNIVSSPELKTYLNTLIEDISASKERIQLTPEDWTIRPDHAKGPVESEHDSHLEQQLYYTIPSTSEYVLGIVTEKERVSSVMHFNIFITKGIAMPQLNHHAVPLHFFKVNDNIYYYYLILIKGNVDTDKVNVSMNP